MNQEPQKPATATKIPVVGSISVADWYNPDVQYNNDDYTQLGNAYRLLVSDDKNGLTANIINHMRVISGSNNPHAFNLQLCHWFRMDMNLGMAIARAFNINLQDFKF